MSESAQTPFHDLDQYVAIPRLTGLVASQDGTRLVAGVQTLDEERTGYRTALWEVDPAGRAPARRLTRSAKGESSAVFTRSGDLLFTSARPDPDGAAGGPEPVPALWLLPAHGGEARVIATAPGGLSAALTARDADTVSVAAGLLPSAKDLKQDAELRKVRKDRSVSAILHTGYPVRLWDHDLGPDQVRRFAGDLTALGDEPASPLPAVPADQSDAAPEESSSGKHVELRALTGAGRHLEEHSADLSADGTTLVTTWAVPDAGAATRSTLVVVDTDTGDRRVLVDDPDADVAGPRISPDGAWVAYVTESISSPDEAPVTRLALVPADGSAEPVVLADDWDRWPGRPTWLPDGGGLLVQADDDGRGPLFLLTFDTPPAALTAAGPGEARPTVTVEKVTADDAVFSDLSVTPDGGTVFALRSSYAAPAEPVRIDLAAFLASGAPGQRTPLPATLLRSPVPAPALSGRLTEVETTAEDGARVRAWLALPADAGPDAKAPLLLWIHGGPLGSWNAWSWRWNPWLMVAQGYAVLLPDPALSTGYGQEFVQRGWGHWGAAPFTDLMAITDATEALPEIDESRTAAMGGSFGGYMANWVAGHTDRFRAVVTHASLWALDQFGPTTDAGFYWAREMTPEMSLQNSPHRAVDQIRTPVLVIHGDKDYRVPIGEGLRLWFELLTKSGLPASDDGETVHRFLYFPDENHWVLTPQNAKVWYQVVSAFLAEQVLGETRELPSTLG